MRYSDAIDPTTVTTLSRVEPSWIVTTAVYGFVLGIAFWIVGRRVQQLWLRVWGGGLSVASVAYFAFTFLLGDGP